MAPSTSPAPAPDSPEIKALNPTNGNPIWSCAIATFSDYWWNSPSLAPDGTVYIGYNSKSYAITNGFTKWVRDFTPLNQCDYAAGSGWVGRHNLHWDMHCAVARVATRWLHEVDGRPAWVLRSAGMCPAVGADGTIYFGTETAFYAVRPNGSFKWTNSVPNQSWWWSPDRPGWNSLCPSMALSLKHAVCPQPDQWRREMGVEHPPSATDTQPSRSARSVQSHRTGKSTSRTEMDHLFARPGWDKDLVE